MIIKRRIYILAVVIALFLATVLIAFIANKDNGEDFKGTLVKGYGQEAVI